MNKTKQKNGCKKWKYGNGKTTGCPTKTFGHDRQCGFTLVELVIVIAIVIILSVISVPIYRGYIDKAKMSEGHALLGTILSAQKAYYSEHGNFLYHRTETCYDTILGVDARGNKYFTWFYSGYANGQKIKYYFDTSAYKPEELKSFGGHRIILQYNITKGSRFTDWKGAAVLDLTDWE